MRTKNIIKAFVYLNFIIASVLATNTFEHIKLSQENGAKCIDGSPPSIWYKPGDPKKFMIIIQGGSWALGEKIGKTKDVLLHAMTTKFGSSTNSYFEKPFEGEYLTSQFKKFNPHFHDYSIVQINNCDKAGQQGYREEPIIHKDQEIWFRGKLNFIESINYLFDELNLDQAENVTLGGFSAGAQSLYYWINYLGDRLKEANPHIKYQGFADSGIFLDRKNMFTQDNQYRMKFQNLFELSNQEEDPINSECVKEFPEEKYRCMFAENNIKDIRYRTLIIQNQYDPSVGSNVIGTDSLRKTKDWSLEEYKEYEDYRENLLDFLNNHVRKLKIKHSIFSAACLQHTTAYKELFSTDDIAIPSGSNFNLEKAMYDFIQKGKDFIKIDQKGFYPDANPKCSPLLPATPYRVSEDNNGQSEVKEEVKVAIKKPIKKSHKSSLIPLILVLLFIILILVKVILKKRKLKQQQDLELQKQTKSSDTDNSIDIQKGQFQSIPQDFNDSELQTTTR